MKKRFSAVQITIIVRKAKTGGSTRELSRKTDISDPPLKPGAGSLPAWKPPK